MVMRPDDAYSRRRIREADGVSLLEIIFVVALMITVAAAAVPATTVALDEYRAAAATRYMAARLQLARMQAVTRSANVAVRFVQTTDGVKYGVYVDGNGDGVRARNIQDHIDRQITPDERLPDQFPGVDFGVLPGLPPTESGSTPPGSDPLKLGSSDMVSFSGLGTSSSGSLYIRGRGNAQYVIRIFGETGRTRILKFNVGLRAWKPL